jgi:hypothetical protein
MGVFSKTCENSPAYISRCCVENESGGVRGVVLVAKSYQRATLLPAARAAKAAYAASAQGDADQATYVAAMETAFQAAIDAGKAWVIPNTIEGGKDASMQEGPGAGDQSKMLVGKEHTLTFSDRNIFGNGVFGEAIENRSDLVVWYCTQTAIWNTHVPAMVATGQKVETSETSIVMHKYEAKWSTLKNEEDFVRPESIFDCEAEDAPPPTPALAPVHHSMAAVSVVPGNTFQIEVDAPDTHLHTIDFNVAFFSLAGAPISDSVVFIAGTPTEGPNNRWTITVQTTGALPVGDYLISASLADVTAGLAGATPNFRPVTAALAPPAPPLEIEFDDTVTEIHTNEGGNYTVDVTVTNAVNAVEFLTNMRYIGDDYATGFTGATDNGGGSYTLAFTVPGGTPHQQFALFVTVFDDDTNAASTLVAKIIHVDF